MQGYRFYFLDRSGAVIGYEQADCADDDAAIGKAGELRPASAPEYTIVEVWRGTQLIHRREAVTHDNEDKLA